MTEPFTDMHCEYGYASGVSYADCVMLGRRWRDAYGTTLSDSDFYVVVNTPDPELEVQTHARWGPWPNIVSGLWRALPSGIVYMADASQGCIHIYPDVMNPNCDIQRCPLAFAPEGVWGLDDEHVYCWGVGRDASSQPTLQLSQFDGQNWTPMPSPGFAVSRLHGVAPDMMYAVGRGGGAARWDGKNWTPLSLQTDENLSDVYVAGANEVYATTLNGSLLESTTTGWTQIARTVDARLPLACVVKFHDELWVGGAFQGLFRRVGRTDQLELVKDNIKATHFEARADSLLITAPNLVAGTADGQNFRGGAINSLLQLTNTIDIAEA